MPWGTYFHWSCKDIIKLSSSVSIQDRLFFLIAAILNLHLKYGRGENNVPLAQGKKLRYSQE